MPSNVDLSFVKGDTVTLLATVLDVNNQPVDLTSPASVCRFTAKAAITDADGTAGGISMVDNQSHASANPSQGITVFELLSTASGSGIGGLDGTNIQEGKYFMDIQYATNGPPVGIYTFIKGTLTVNAEVTETNSVA